jgi:hypothetical protein
MMSCDGGQGHKHRVHLIRTNILGLSISDASRIETQISSMPDRFWFYARYTSVFSCANCNSPHIIYTHDSIPICRISQQSCCRMLSRCEPVTIPTTTDTPEVGPSTWADAIGQDFSYLSNLIAAAIEYICILETPGQFTQQASCARATRLNRLSLHQKHPVANPTNVHPIWHVLVVRPALIVVNESTAAG